MRPKPGAGALVVRVLLAASGVLGWAAHSHAFDVYNPRTLVPNAVSFRYAVPDAIDWDSDGDWDLVVGEWGVDDAGYFGGIRLYLNTGDDSAPNLVFDSYLKAGGAPIRVGYG